MLLLPTSHALGEHSPDARSQTTKYTAVADVNQQIAIVIDATDTPSRSTIANHYL
jgi:hypothetical protein